LENNRKTDRTRPAGDNCRVEAHTYDRFHLKNEQSLISNTAVSQCFAAGQNGGGGQSEGAKNPRWTLAGKVGKRVFGRPRARHFLAGIFEGMNADRWR
jgi:hypothetical protein